MKKPVLERNERMNHLTYSASHLMDQNRSEVIVLTTICTPHSPQHALIQKPATPQSTPTGQLEIQKKIAQEFADRVAKIPSVVGVVATTHEHLLHVWTCLCYRIPREQEYAVYNAEGEILQKYADQIPLDFESRTVASTEQLKELLSCQHSYIVYQEDEEKLDTC